MVDPRLILDVLPALSITIGVIYYIMVLRNQEKARQIQLFQQLVQRNSKDQQIEGMKLMQLKWNDYDDFEIKYGSDNNPEIFALRYEWWTRFNQTGLLVRDGLIDIDRLMKLHGGTTAPYWHWNKFSEVIKKQRELYNLPELFSEFEYLALEYANYMEKKGYPMEIPELVT